MQDMKSDAVAGAAATGNCVRILEVASVVHAGQRPGTSGLRKKTRVFMQPHYLENFVQSVFDQIRAEAAGDLSQETLVTGGDGRYYNDTAIQIILNMAAANGFGRVLVARDGLLSTPAMSAVIRAHNAAGGLLLTASHNPGGIDADFGIKFNTRSGGPAPEEVTEAIYQRTQKIDTYRTLSPTCFAFDRVGEYRLFNTRIVVFDPLTDYTALLQNVFDFDALRSYIRDGNQVCVDAMHGVTGPYARHIFEDLLDAPAGSVIRGVPLLDFGGLHPDPAPMHVPELTDRMNTPDGPVLGAACDGDGDRNLILGRGLFVSPGDSLAIIAEHARDCIPAYRAGLTGIARSMPTSTAPDRVAAELGIPCYETPTGWKYFGELLDAGLCTLCGEESFGTGSNHIREKDGIWAVLCWLSILASTGRTVTEIVHDHWRRFGRSYYQRHDFDGLDSEDAADLMRNLVGQLASLKGRLLAGSTVTTADDFHYQDPVSGKSFEHGGLRILLEDGSRIVYRLSGTGTGGATLRVYLERYRKDRGRDDINKVLAPLRDAALQLSEIRERCGRETATQIT